jgi:hypothetical protein
MPTQTRTVRTVTITFILLYLIFIFAVRFIFIVTFVFYFSLLDTHRGTDIEVKKFARTINLVCVFELFNCILFAVAFASPHLSTDFEAT